MTEQYDDDTIILSIGDDHTSDDEHQTEQIDNKQLYDDEQEISPLEHDQ